MNTDGLADLLLPPRMAPRKRAGFLGFARWFSYCALGNIFNRGEGCGKCIMALGDDTGSSQEPYSKVRNQQLG